MKIPAQDPHQRRGSLLRSPSDSFREQLSWEPPDPGYRAPADALVVSQLRLSREFSCAVDRLADSQVRTTAAKVGDLPLNINIGWVRILRQERRRCHDLSGLAIAALRHVPLAPSNLRRMLSVSRQAFNRSDFLSHCLTDSRDAGPDRFAVQVNSASPASG